MHPSSPKVTITKLMFGNLNRMETRALGRDGASVHACHTSSLNVVPYILPRILEQQLARACVCVLCLLNKTVHPYGPKDLIMSKSDMMNKHVEFGRM